MGLGVCTQFAPFQRKIKVLPAVPLEKAPTAQALLAEVAVTASSLLSVPGAGLATWDHFVPFQRRIRVRWDTELEASPTAQALVADTASTALRSPVPGLGCCTQAVPFQCSISVLSSACPTAQMLLGENALTALRKLVLVPGLGVGTTVQAVPFQCSARLSSGPLAVAR